MADATVLGEVVGGVASVLGAFGAAFFAWRGRVAANRQQAISDAAKQQLAFTESSLRNARLDVDRARTEATRLQTRVDELEAEVDDTRQHRNRALAERDQARRDLAAAHARIAHLERQQR